MLLIGHRLVPFEPLYPIETADEIVLTPAGSTVLFEYSPDLIWHCQENRISFALHVSAATEAIIGNGAGAHLLIASSHLVPELQELAEHYLFDAKIALMIDSEEGIALAALKRVDAAILPEGIVTWKS
ncbi:hypothetical protein JWV37_01970 [Sulfurospirillum sp. T05]|uniref:Uncharacterized protein n=1 Tax=Sulfurospirillum tamanense TaxID=2813362 RepID=A0ABS2WPH3_9BACT|nr:hypothetical protein [Sulfurospirillum tamanensis]MBN2963532.1 hypothetical protein [Sulfurospirillum tamanensis]